MCFNYVHFKPMFSKLIAGKIVFFISSILILTFLLISSPGPAAEINLTRSKLVQLALHLEAADKQLQYDFSRIAIVEMIRSYEHELLRSQTNLPVKQKKRAKVYRWQIATKSYLNSLDEYLFQMDSGETLDFLINKQNKLMILIGKQAVIISGPNSGGDKQIENKIVEQFCIQYDCHEYFIVTQENKNNSVKLKLPSTISDDFSGSWSIRSDLKADLAITNGVIFRFSNIQHRLDKEIWAIQIASELERLVKQLKITKEKGYSIQWLSLSLNDLPVTDRAQKVIINQKQDYIKLPLPILGKHQSLFFILIPWIKSNIDNKKDYRIMIENADKYLYAE